MADKLLHRVFKITLRCGCGGTYAKHCRPGSCPMEEVPVPSSHCTYHNALPVEVEEVKEPDWSLVKEVYDL